jgi:hypothetical protein
MARNISAIITLSLIGSAVHADEKAARVLVRTENCLPYVSSTNGEQFRKRLVVRKLS